MLKLEKTQKIGRFSDRSVRYKNSYDRQRGRCLLVRWTNSQSNFGNKLKFEAAIFENGTIEFRYWPIETYEPGDAAGLDSSATVGIFWNGTSAGTALRFRDFAPLLGYSVGLRNINPLGGASYDSSYVEGYTPYSSAITKNYWPANGGIITFSPPVNAGKFLPQKTAKAVASTKRTIAPAGLFDDKKSLIFGLTTSSAYPVHMPSTLSTRFIGQTNPEVDTSFRQHLFTSGSIIVSGSHKKQVIEGLLQASDALSENSNTFNNSFNESSKNSIGPGDSLFYTLGTLDLGEKTFENNLKSKTQFHFSLPITKPVLMPSSSSSLYYYDVVRQTWSHAVPEEESVAPPQITVALGSDASVNNRWMSIIETSRGFDAVGRKVISGSKNSDTQYYQSTEEIGLIINSGTISAEEKVDQILNRPYTKSITDNADYYPEQNEQITFNSDYPFLIEKIVAKIPIYASGSWFEDLTTVNKAFGSVAGATYGFASGAIDFGGPAITFAVHCPRRAPGSSYMDLIASGTITHNFDNTSSIKLYKDSGMSYTCLRPVGFNSFSNPTAVVSGTWNGTCYEFDGYVKLEMEAAVHGGISFARNDIATGSIYPRRRALSLLTSASMPLRSEVTAPYGSIANYQGSDTRTRVHVQQISPISRGTSRFEFNGNSVLGRGFTAFNLDAEVKNPLYIAPSSSLPSSIKSIIDSPSFTLDALMQYTTVDNYVSPYLIYPGDKLTFSISKTRPVIYFSNYLGVFQYGAYNLTGSHNGVILNTGSLDLTFYGSYIREGRSYNP